MDAKLLGELCLRLELESEGRSKPTSEEVAEWYETGEAARAGRGTRLTCACGKPVMQASLQEVVTAASPVALKLAGHRCPGKCANQTFHPVWYEYGGTPRNFDGELFGEYVLTRCPSQRVRHIVGFVADHEGQQVPSVGVASRN